MDLLAVTNLAFAGVAVFAAILSAIAVAALRRAPSPRMGLVATGFLLVTVQGIVVGIGLFGGIWSPEALLLLTAIFEAGLLAVLFLATLVR
jgi:hypothetical protein